MFGDDAQDLFNKLLKYRKSTEFCWIKGMILNFPKLDYVQRLFLGKHTKFISGYFEDFKYLIYLGVEFK